MKTTIVFLLMSCVALITFGQSASTPKVPEAAKADLAQRFATSAVFKWYQEGNQFEAEYVENGKEIAVAYSAQGKWMETEHELDKEALPAAFLSGFQSAFPQGEIVGVESVERPDKPLAYEVKFYIGKSFHEKMFDPAGHEEEGLGGSGSEGSGDDGSEDEE